MSGHDTREAAQADCDRANRAPLKGVTLAPRRCGACNGVGHTSRSKACPYHPDAACLTCGVSNRLHVDQGHRFRSRPTIGELTAAEFAPAVKP
jgi:hypothetical protein